MPRVHPKKSIVPDQVTSSQVSINKKEKATVYQASTVYEVDSRENGMPIGSNGELKGFGKSAIVYKKIPTERDAVQEMNTWATGSSILFRDSQNMEQDARVGGDRGLLTRAVASYQIDSFLGLGTLAEEKHGVDKNGKPLGISVQVNGVPVNEIRGDKMRTLDIDYSDPQIQRGLFDLEASDYITGQIDRHLGNVYIDSTTGKVKGIDNDLCLPEKPRTEVMQDILASGKSIVTMPTMMHEETAQKILKADPNELRERLRRSQVPGSQPLSEEAIEGAVTRLKELQTELGKGEQSSIKVVKQFDKNTYKEAMARQEQEFLIQTKGKDYAAVKNDYDAGGEALIRGCASCVKTSLLGKAGLEQILAGITTDRNVMHQDINIAHRRDSTSLEEGRAYQLMPREEQKDFDKQFAKLSEKEKQLEKREAHLKHLAKPTFLDKVASIGEGGVKGARRHDERSIEKLRAQIRELNESLDQRLDAHKPQQDLGVPPENQHQVQRRDSTELSRSQGVEVSGADVTTTDPQQQPSENVDGGHKPTLTKQESVRDLLREQGAVKTAKEKLGIDGEKVGKGMDTGGIKRDNSGPKTTVKVKQ